MPKVPSEPIRRVDMNLYKSDVEYLERSIGSGWSTFIRELVREYVLKKTKPKTVEDFLK